ncbi:endosome protein [Coprinopsis cinerea okayama7|uniref:Endosome protein n=1 Tax=Coprinopsis cinerea (strain Okayama-7 / 130 / ATCC MYA-4618 / FGSC 9003) TaxID=240176 RepID=A8NJC6_COPC7|nr:endosome protein [Coprinopsis cinerea okayama7\|eukprot:XP_001834194.1 endosome protein [Coprinopsis cinerea okayama7\
MGFLSKLKSKVKEHVGSSSSDQGPSGYYDHHNQYGTDSSLPPAWTPAPEVSHKWGKWNEAPDDEYQAGEDFCLEYPPNPPRLLPSAAVDYISSVGCKAWSIEQPETARFSGTISNPGDFKGSLGVVKISTNENCKDTTLLSTLPIMAGLYDVQGKSGVYYEVLIKQMDGVVVVGTSCRPYPAWRLPGWNRLSAGLHLDDLRKFFEDPDGGRDYVTPDLVSQVRPGDTIGCGYEFSTGGLFFTYNGIRLSNAFTGIYLPRHEHDVFAAVGVEGRAELEVNFGGDMFRWKEGNEWAWRVEGHVGKIVGSSREYDAELPAYSL